jgi:hypothetical protein
LSICLTDGFFHELPHSCWPGGDPNAPEQLLAETEHRLVGDPLALGFRWYQSAASGARVNRLRATDYARSEPCRVFFGDVRL